MVKIKINKVEYPEEEKYIGGVYEAFKIKLPDGRYDYVTYVEEDRLIGVKPENCEIISDETTSSVVLETTQSQQNKILLVEDGSVDIDDLEEWCEEQGIKLVVYRNGGNKPEFLNY